MSTVVTLDRYAGMRAEMDAGMLRDDVLARAGITTDDWTAAQHEWLDKMGKELERDRFELTNRYTQAFMERLRALTELAATERQTLPAPAKPAKAASQSAPVDEEEPDPDTSDFGPQRPELPPHSLPSPRSEPSPWMQHARSETAGRTAQQPSYVTAPTPPAAAPAPSPPVLPQAADPSETMAFAGMVREVVPFKHSNEPYCPPTEAPARPVYDPDGPDGTMDLSAVLAHLTAALPFRDGASATAAPPAGKHLDTGPRPTISSDVEATIFGALAPATPALPFDADASAHTSPFGADLRDNRPRPAVSDDAGATVFAALAPATPTLPFDTAASLQDSPPDIDSGAIPTRELPPIVALSLEQYAALCAELAMFPADAERAFSSYGLALPETRRKVDAAFRELLARDPESQRRWQELYTHYRARLFNRRPA